MDTYVMITIFAYIVEVLYGSALAGFKQICAYIMLPSSTNTLPPISPLPVTVFRVRAPFAS